MSETPDESDVLATLERVERDLAYEQKRNEELSFQNDYITAKAASLIEQRDRLAEAVKSIASGAVQESMCIKIAREALAAVEGGDK